MTSTSSRFMFRFTTEKVISQLRISVEEINDISAYKNATVGFRSDGVINRLFGWSLAGKIEKVLKSHLISQFAGFLISVRLGPDLIKYLAKTVVQDSNPAMNGWFLEMWFFASLRNGGVSIKKDETIIHWKEVASVEIFDIDSFQSIPDQEGVWLKPKKWNQGGFDAVFIYQTSNLENIVRFVQITGGKRHCFKIEYFSMVLKGLDNHFKIHKIEIFYLVEQTKLSTFSIPGYQVTGKTEEVYNVQIVGLDGWK